MSQLHARTETCIHVVRDCGRVGGIWEGLGLEVWEEKGFERVREWVEEVMREGSEVEWVKLMVGCWAIWERRNKVVFEGVPWCETEVVDRVNNMTWEMREMIQSCAEGKGAVGANEQGGGDAGGQWKGNTEGQSCAEGKRAVGVNEQARGDVGGQWRRSAVWQGRDGVEEQGRWRADGQERGDEEVGWRRPMRGIYKINVDAGIKSGFGVAWGVVCRDEDGVV